MTATLKHTAIKEALKRACKRIAPLWPLESFVAVNPYLGLAEHDFQTASERLRRVAGANMTLPTEYYLRAWFDGIVTAADLEQAIEQSDLGPLSVEELLRQSKIGASNGVARHAEVQTVADVAKTLTGEDWGHLCLERVSAWAGAYFDQGQAQWRTKQHDSRAWPASEANHSLYTAWRAEAAYDRTPEIMGLRHFRATVKALPREPFSAASEILRRLEVPQEGLELYLHRVLLRVGGWSAYCAWIGWERALHDKAEDDTLAEFLCVLLSWEAAIYEAFGADGLIRDWSWARRRLPSLASAKHIEAALARDLVWQAAFEIAHQRQLAARLKQNSEREQERRALAGDVGALPARPSAQAAFCIDVRSEVYRRHLETADSTVETLGFAGFFGFPIELFELGHQKGRAQCPALLKPTYRISEGLADEQDHDRALRGRKLTRQVKHAWKSFKSGAVSRFAFVSPMGLSYLPKLVGDAFGITRPVPDPSRDGLDRKSAAAKEVQIEERTVDGQHFGMSLEQRVEVAAGVLAAMSLTEGFARIVMLAGHGSSTVNNPHASGLDCGACGGRSGEANARVAATTFNDLNVRTQLAERGIVIPDDCFFVAALHDTTTDVVTIFNRDSIPQTHRRDVEQLERSLEQAGRGCRAERALRFHDADSDAAVLARSRDWAQIRPEWGLAGCSAFIVAPRERTKAISLEGRSFLHSYDWQRDEGFSVLELIMTAPMVVASWISLQYYGSTVDNRLFGSGNKTLHNVVGTLGVLEGNAGDLRVGLPLQSVHDGDGYQHQPLRLNVVIEAPLEAMNAVIEKHESVRNLLDNGWLHLFAMNADGQLSHRYRGALAWQQLEQENESRARPALNANESRARPALNANESRARPALNANESWARPALNANESVPSEAGQARESAAAYPSVDVEPVFSERPPIAG
jgi:uncharacterized protein YbcC (UPF0753/DUF2309 family)